MVLYEIPSSVLVLLVDWFRVKMNDVLIPFTSCSLAGVFTLANATFCHGDVIPASALTLSEVVSPLFGTDTKWRLQILIYES
jgi:hypothetical protein